MRNIDSDNFLSLLTQNGQKVYFKNGETIFYNCEYSHPYHIYSRVLQNVFPDRPQLVLQ